MRAEHTGDTLHIRNRQTAPHTDTHETIVAEHCEMFRYSHIAGVGMKSAELKHRAKLSEWAGRR